MLLMPLMCSTPRFWMVAPPTGTGSLTSQYAHQVATSLTARATGRIHSKLAHLPAAEYAGARRCDNSGDVTSLCGDCQG